MGFLDRLFGRREEQPAPQPQQRRNPPGSGQSPEEMTDEQAVERYRYMLRTAPPDAVEQAHAEAFTRLTPEQRKMVLDELSRNVPEGERSTSDDPQSLARMATRAEMRQPGTMERTFSNVGGGSGGGGMGGGGLSMGGLLAGSFFGGMAGMFVGSMIANSFFGHSDYGQQYNESSAAGDQADGSGSDGGDGGDTGDSGSGDSGSSDGGVGDYGGDYGGGDFGGGDFGGGDF